MPLSSPKPSRFLSLEESWSSTLRPWPPDPKVKAARAAKINMIVPQSLSLTFGVSQGSVLGPLLFTLYTTPLSSMISGHTISHHHYGDGSQLHVSFASGDSAVILNGFQSCLPSVQPWMSTNRLKLNPSKTAFLLIGNEQQWSKYPSRFPVELFGVKTNPAKSAQNLGIIFDKNFTLHSHISAVCSSCFYHIWDLQLIHCYLDPDSAKFLATAHVSSLDYSNSLSSIIADTGPAKLQSIQNQLALVVTKWPPFTGSVSLLRSLHWLPIKFRILFKISVFTYKMLHEKQPVFLHSMLASSLPFRSPRSSKGISLSIPGVRTSTGTRAIHCCLWEQPAAVCPFSHFSCYLQEASEDTSLWHCLFSIDTSTPDGPLMLRNCFINFVVEH